MPPPTKQFPTTLGDFHLVPPGGGEPPNGYSAGSFEVASLAGILIDIDGHVRVLGETDMGAHAAQACEIVTGRAG